MTDSPDSSQAQNRLGDALLHQGKLDEAIRCFRRAIELQPDFFPAHNNLGNALQEKGELEAAVRSFKQAIVLQPVSPQAWNNLGAAEQARGNLAEALRYFRRAVNLAPEMAAPWNNLAGAELETGQIREAIASWRRALAADPDFEDARNNLLLALHYPADLADAEIAAELSAWNSRHPPAVACLRTGIDRDPERRLRVGFLSGNFHRHPVGYFMVGALPALDRAQVEVIAYATNRDADELTGRLRAGVDHWHGVDRLSHAALAAKIAGDRIDVLIELSGHARGGRLEALARRPAPVQAALAGHYCSTGSAAIDYFICDAIEAPPGADDLYTERLLRLKHSRVCYTPPEDAPPVAELPALRNGFVTFGSFNNPSKLSEPTLDLWGRILAALPDSRLLLKYRRFDRPEVQARLHPVFARHGVAPDRVVLEGGGPPHDLLTRYGAIDIGLDPFPYGGGLTTCEALWMGVPVVTLPQQRFASRTTASHVHNVGLGDWIAASEDAYLGLALGWARRPAELSALRQGLRERMRRSPLCDAAAYGRDLSAALRTVWREWCRSGRA